MNKTAKLNLIKTMFFTNRSYELKKRTARAQRINFWTTYCKSHKTNYASGVIKSIGYHLILPASTIKYLKAKRS